MEKKDKESASTSVPETSLKLSGTDGSSATALESTNSRSKVSFAPTAQPSKGGPSKTKVLYSFKKISGVF